MLVLVEDVEQEGYEDDGLVLELLVVDLSYELGIIDGVKDG